MKTISIIAAIIIFFLVIFIGKQYTSIVELQKQTIVLDSILLELDSMKLAHKGLCEAMGQLTFEKSLENHSGR